MEDFQLTWRRILFAIAIALLGFLLPQDIPLEYCSLNNPSSGLQYLEITCAANFTGIIVIYLDIGKGFNEADLIKWPISPSTTVYTYTFPLLDAPLYRLRLSTLNALGELLIANCRIINRRGEEIHRFNTKDFMPLKNSVGYISSPSGLIVKATNNLQEHSNNIALNKLLIAEGMNERNFKRCLISWSYLSLMIWIINLAVFFTFFNGGSVFSIIRVIVYLAFLAILFSAVGNRGIIVNSFKYALISNTINIER
jgi:hypothetical protein